MSPGSTARDAAPPGTRADAGFAESGVVADAEQLAAIAHELRTPLTSMLAFTDLINSRAKESGDTRVREMANAIRRNGERLNELINDVLDVAKIEAGRVTLNCGPTNLRVLVGDVLESMGPLIAERKQTISMEWDPAVKEVEVDSGRLVQIVSNLLSNASKYSAPGAPVVLRVTAEGDNFALCVIDRGIGIKAEDLPKIFSPFFRAPVGETRIGSGLGLAITRALTHLHGGEITVESQYELGSEFTVRIPLKQPEPKRRGMNGVAAD